MRDSVECLSCLVPDCLPILLRSRPCDSWPKSSLRSTLTFHSLLSCRCVSGWMERKARCKRGSKRSCVSAATWRVQPRLVFASNEHHSLLPCIERLKCFDDQCQGCQRAVAVLCRSLGCLCTLKERGLAVQDSARRSWHVPFNILCLTRPREGRHDLSLPNESRSSAKPR